MRRVLLLVCLIISLVELDWERDRIYLLSSLASLSLVLNGERMRLRKLRGTVRPFKAAEVTSSEAYASDSLHLDRADQMNSGPSRAAVVQARVSTTISIMPIATSRHAKNDSAVDKFKERVVGGA